MFNLVQKKRGVMNMHNLTNKKIKSTPQMCQLEEDKVCDNCCHCFICDLDAEKLCDNCAMCLNIPDYNGVLIDDILILEEHRSNRNKARKKA